MSESAKIRIKAAILLVVLIVGSPLFFLLAGLHEQFFVDDPKPRGSFLWGLKIMAQTYLDVVPDLWNEFKFGVTFLDDF